jgi:Na+/H+ antiporter NhaD/arsenite permease-like protein
LSVLGVVALSSPLVFLLLSLAILPLVASKFWAKYENSVLVALSLASIILSIIMLKDTAHILKHTIINDYISFIITLFVLYTLSHGIRIDLKCPPTSLANIVLLLVFSIFSSIIGTTGASVLFLRPFLQINEARQNKAHLVIFFIFLVSNIGGILSPLGDPPLFLGYLHGVDFTWEIKNLSACWGVYTALCLGVLFCIDSIFVKGEDKKIFAMKKKISIQIKGGFNGGLLLLAIIILFSNIGIPVLLKNILLLIICFISYLFEGRHGRKIDVGPFKEVAGTFLAIFIAMAPVLAILSDNSDVIHGYISDVSKIANEPTIYFWMCSLASAFLDNAPSYLLFFNMAGGDGQDLMRTCPEILKAISVSAVVMGSMTYIGNAPNMLVRALSLQNGVRMPSFIAYILWSSLIILPISMIIVNLML